MKGHSSPRLHLPAIYKKKILEQFSRNKTYSEVLERKMPLFGVPVKAQISEEDSVANTWWPALLF